MRRLRFDVPLWHVFLHREARELPPVEEDDKPARQLEDELFDRLFAGGGEPLPHPDNGELAAWSEKLHATCEQLPAFGRLVEECLGDADAAGSAVETLMAELAPHLKTKPQDANDAALRKVIGNGCEKASGTVADQRETKEALDGVGFRLPGTGSAKGERFEHPSSRFLAARLKNDDRLRRIAMLAGKFKRIAARKQRSKVKHGADEITDVEMGSELSRLLPVELAGLLNPRRKLAFLRDLIENRALQYKLEGTDSLGRGPLVVCLDKSGSMSGPSDIWATAVALALLEIAHRQRRHFAVLSFDALVKHEVIVRPGEPLPESALFVGCAGGTSIERVLRRSLEIIQDSDGAMKKADVVLITDGQSDGNNAPQVRQVAKEMGVTMLGIGIGVDESDLEPWCDEAHAIQRLDDIDDETAEKLFTL